MIDDGTRRRWRIRLRRALKAIAAATLFVAVMGVVLAYRLPGQVVCHVNGRRAGVSVRLSSGSINNFNLKVAAEWGERVRGDEPLVTAWRMRRYEWTEPLLIPEARVYGHRLPQETAYTLRLEVPYLTAALLGVLLWWVAGCIRPRGAHGFPVRHGERESETGSIMP